ncbi:MAG: GNAT family N-acetyltransferase [Aristaeellaceae bacterium]
MTLIRRVTPETAHTLRILMDPVLVGDVTLLRIGRNTLSLGYLPAKPAAMVVFAPDEQLDFTAALTEPSMALFAAYEEEQCIGTALVRVSSGNGWADLLDIRVAVTCCRRGIARSLMEACEAFACRHGAEGLHMAIPDSNPGACQFAEQCGFSLQGFDKLALTFSRTERVKPLAARAVLLHFYRNKKG